MTQEMQCNFYREAGLLSSTIAIEMVWVLSVFHEGKVKNTCRRPVATFSGDTGEAKDAIDRVTKRQERTRLGVGKANNGATAIWLPSDLS